MPISEAIFRSLSLAIMGDLGMTSMVVSGLFLMNPYWDGLFEMSLLMIKLGLVIVLLEPGWWSGA
jgi:hypothetical protein